MRHDLLKACHKRIAMLGQPGATLTAQGYTQYGGLRPFGVSLLYAGWDEQNKCAVALLATSRIACIVLTLTQVLLRVPESAKQQGLPP